MPSLILEKVFSGENGGPVSANRMKDLLKQTERKWRVWGFMSCSSLFFVTTTWN